MARLEPVKMSSSDRQWGDKRAEIDMNTGVLNRSRPVVVMTLFGERSMAVRGPRRMGDPRSSQQ